MKKIITLASVLLIALTLVACNGTRSENEKPVVMTTLFPQYDFARQIAGDLIELEFLLPPGTDAHTFEPSPRTVARIISADLLIYTGDDMEPWVSTLIQSSRSDSLKLLDLSKNVNLIDGHHHDHDDHHDDDHHDHDHHDHDHHDHDHHEHDDHHDDDHHDHDHHDHDHHDDDHHDHDHHDHDHHDHDHHDHDHHDHDHDHGDYDPHIWTDPLNAMIMIYDILDALIELLPEHEAQMRENANIYVAELQVLHQQFQDLRANAELTVMMYGGHNAMGYFIHRYRLSYVNPYRGFSTDSEPTPQALAHMIDLMNELNIEHLFSEKLIAPNVANAIAENTGAKILYVYTMHNAPVDDFNRGITFIEMMEHNLNQFRIGLRYRGN